MRANIYQPLTLGHTLLHTAGQNSLINPHERRQHSSQESSSCSNLTRFLDEKWRHRVSLRGHSTDWKEQSPNPGSLAAGPAFYAHTALWEASPAETLTSAQGRPWGPSVPVRRMEQKSFHRGVDCRLARTCGNPGPGPPAPGKARENVTVKVVSLMTPRPTPACAGYYLSGTSKRRAISQAEEKTGDQQDPRQRGCPRGLSGGRGQGSGGSRVG